MTRDHCQKLQAHVDTYLAGLYTQDEVIGLAIDLATPDEMHR